MDIASHLEKEHSKALTLRIVQYIGANPKRLADLMDVYLGKNPKLAQRAAWVLGHFDENNSEMVLPYVSQMLEKVANPKVHNAVKRNALKVFMALPNLPEEEAGELLGYCFDAVASPQEAPAIRAYALTLITRLAANQPDLMRELGLIIEEQMPIAPAAFRSRGRKILKMLE